MATDSPTNRRARLGDPAGAAVVAGLVVFEMVAVAVAVAAAGVLRARIGPGVDAATGDGRTGGADTGVRLTVESAA